MKLLFCTLIFLACVCTMVLCEQGIIVPSAPQDYKIYRHEPVGEFNLNEDKNEVSFKAYGQTWKFSVWLSNVRDDNEHHFHGVLKDDNDKEDTKWSSFTIMPDHVTGMIVLQNDTLWLEAKDSNKPEELFIHRQSEMSVHPDLIPRIISRAVPEHVAREAERSQIEERISSYRLKLFFDQNWATGPWNTIAKTTGLVNDVNTLLRNAGLGIFNLNQAWVRKNNGFGNGQLEAMLNAIGAVAPAGFTNTAWLVGRNIGGIAWVGTSCNANYASRYKTAVCGMTSWSRLFTVKTLAHELGHNRGANHDFVNQCSANNVPTCQCSVMSYCWPEAGYPGGAVNKYSRRSINEMRSAGCN